MAERRPGRRWIIGCGIGCGIGLRRGGAPGQHRRAQPLRNRLASGLRQGLHEQRVLPPAVQGVPAEHRIGAQQRLDLAGLRLVQAPIDPGLQAGVILNGAAHAAGSGRVT
jgi:hypothetical protein